MPIGPILIVEDDPVIRGLLLDLLEIEGYRAVAAADGRAALRMALNETPSLILLDLNLPLLDGEGVLRELGRLDVDAPVLLVTADPRGGRLRRAQSVVGFLAKPFNLDELMRAIERAWLRRTQVSEA